MFIINIQQAIDRLSNSIISNLEILLHS